MKDLKIRKDIALIIGIVCISIIFGGSRLLPISFFYATIVSYIGCLLLIILALKYLLGINLKDHFLKVTNENEGSFLKKFPFLSGLAICFLYSLIFIFIKKSGFNIILGDKNINPIGKVFLVVICAPVIEEVLFRGYIQDLIKSRFFPHHKKNITFWYPIAITSFIFAILHLCYLHTVSSLQLIFIIILALSIGLLSGFLRSKYGHIKYSIKVHIGANLGGMLVIPIALLIGILDMSEYKEMTKGMETYQFDMNKDAVFTNDLSRFFASEFVLNKTAKKMEINCWIPFLIHCDKNGNIIDVRFDTIQAKRLNYKYSNLGLEKDALKTLSKLPKFIPKKGMIKDTTIKHTFYVYHTNK